jgi:peptidoglycan/LPS O-acetylase OafA/YrhL
MTTTPRGWIDRFVTACKRIFELEEEKSRNGMMEGVRGFAVLMVFCVHYHAAFEAFLDHQSWSYTVSYFFSELGHCGVDLFFVLSGYLIYAASLKPGLRIGLFWKRRIQRIYPTFLVVFLIYLALSFVFTERSKIPEALVGKMVFFVGNLLLVAGLLPIQPLITVTWSLSFEVFFYFLMPVVALACGLASASPRYRKRLFIGVSAVFIVLFLAGPLYRGGYWTPARMLMFVVGIFLYEARSSTASVHRPGAAVKWWLLFVLALCGYFWLFELSANLYDSGVARIIVLGKVLILAIPFYGLLNTYFSGGSAQGGFFGFTPMRWLGNMSYSYYLIHSLVIHFAAYVALRVIPKSALAEGASLIYWGLMPLVLAATFGVATVLFVAVEKPLSLSRR